VDLRSLLELVPEIAQIGSEFGGVFLEFVVNLTKHIPDLDEVFLLALEIDLAALLPPELTLNLLPSSFVFLLPLTLPHQLQLGQPLPPRLLL
jgi:hypothetical protein